MGLRLAAVVLAAVLGVTGCGDDPASSADPDPTGSRSPSATDEPSTTGPAPADGPLVRMPPGSFRAPRGWKLSDESLGGWFAMKASSPDHRQSVFIAYYDEVSWTLDTVTRKSRESLDGMVDGGVRVGDPTDVGGHPAYHVFSTKSFDRRDVYGFLVDGYWITLDFSVFDPEHQPDQAVIDSVLASWTSR